MSRAEYMEQLAYLLQDVSEQEREEALAWYEAYFDEAGPEQEAKVIQELGSPEKIAAMIKDGLNGGNEEAGEYTDAGYRDERFREDNKVPEPRTIHLQEEKDADNSCHVSEAGKKGKRSRGEVLLILMLCVLAIPVLFRIVKGVFGAIFGLVGGVFGLLFGIIGVILALAIVIPVCVVVAVICGIVCIGIGIAQIFLSPGVGFLLLGGGFLALTVGILLLIVCVCVFQKVIPWAVRTVVGFFRRIFKVREA